MLHRFSLCYMYGAEGICNIMFASICLTCIHVFFFVFFCFFFLIHLNSFQIYEKLLSGLVRNVDFI